MTSPPTGEIRCDVRELPPPEPMNRVLSALERLIPGGYVRMLHRMEPVPLYGILGEMGYSYQLYLEGEAPYEILIYHQEDSLASARVMAEINNP